MSEFSAVLMSYIPNVYLFVNITTSVSVHISIENAFAAHLFFISSIYFFLYSTKFWSNKYKLSNGYTHLNICLFVYLSFLWCLSRISLIARSLACLPTIIVEFLGPFPWNNNWNSQKNLLHKYAFVIGSIFPKGHSFWFVVRGTFHMNLLLLLFHDGISFSFFSVSIHRFGHMHSHCVSFLWCIYICQYGDSSEKIKRLFMVGKCAALCYIYIWFWLDLHIHPMDVRVCVAVEMYHQKAHC